jgi:hypothetical protein
MLENETNVNYEDFSLHITTLTYGMQSSLREICVKITLT